jgi:predicted phosphodiesterase
MRTLVISDIHNRTVQAQRLLDEVKYDRAILLGDYFDQFNDTPDHAHNTALWLKEFVLDNPKITALIGNHDQYYYWPWYSYLLGSGFTTAKSHAIRKVLNQSDFEKLKFFTIDQGFVLSHAGVSSQVWKEIMAYESYDGPNTIEMFTTILERKVDANIAAISQNRPAELFMAGYDRGGSVRNGGMTWVDWSSFGPVKGINQIVGHTPHVLPDILVQGEQGSLKRYTASQYYTTTINWDKITSKNFALDTHGSHYIIIEDGKVDIYDTKTNLTVGDMLKQNIPIGDDKDEVEMIESLKIELRKQALESMFPEKKEEN